MLPSPIDITHFVHVRSTFAPNFAPDSQHLVVLSNLTGVPQAWQVGLAGEWPEQLTFFDERVGDAVYAPGRHRLLLSTDTGGDEAYQLWLLDDLASAGGKPALRRLTNAPGVIHNFGGWATDGQRIAYASNARDARFFDIYVSDVETGAVERVYQQDGNNSAAAWLPGGRSLIVHHADAPFQHDLYQLDWQSRQARHLTPHAGYARYTHVHATPDGRGLYLLTDQDRDFLAVAYLDLGSGRLTFLETPDWDVEYLALSPDGRRLAFVTNVDGTSLLSIRDLASGRNLTVTGLPDGVIEEVHLQQKEGHLAWSPDSQRLAFALHSATRPVDVWLWEASADGSGGRCRQITFSSRAGIPASRLVTPELVRYPTFDGRQVPALLYRPLAARPGQPLPVVVYVHGGPEAQTRPGFDYLVQYLVNRGYGVLAPNVRGSTGYGNTYAHLDDVRRRMDSVRDLAEAATWLSASGIADPRRIAVFGRSYGGFMVLSAITTYPDLWAAAVDIVGIANFVTFLERTGPWRRKLREAEYGSLANDADFLRTISPIHQVDRIRCPLFVVAGARDPRVPASESDQIVASLQARHHPVTYLRFEDEGHGPIRIPNRVTAYTAIGEFLDHYLM